MKKMIFALSLLLAATTASAHGWHGGREGYRGPGFGWWVGPAIVGGVITYELTHPAPVYVEPAPVYVPVPAEPAVQFFCQPLNQYYPATQTCPAPWLKVVP